MLGAAAIVNGSLEDEKVTIQHFLMTLAILAAGAGGPAAAQAYPQKNIQYIIPFVPGGESDVMARWQQTIFRLKYKHEMVVVNKPGAGGGLAW
jgi:putative tricarboxylic transport membrane protein